MKTKIIVLIILSLVISPLSFALSQADITSNRVLSKTFAAGTDFFLSYHIAMLAKTVTERVMDQQKNPAKPFNGQQHKKTRAELCFALPNLNLKRCTSILDKLPFAVLSAYNNYLNTSAEEASVNRKIKTVDPGPLFMFFMLMLFCVLPRSFWDYKAMPCYEYSS